MENSPSPTHLDTPRLTLREFVESDFEALRQIDGDPRVLRYRSRQVIPEETTREFLRACASFRKEVPRNMFPWAILLRAEERLIGQVGLTLLAGESRAAFLWYSLNPHYWGCGYMREAVQAVIDYAFQHLGLHAVEAFCQAENIASWHIMERAGMKRIAEEKVNRDWRGEFIEYCYRITSPPPSSQTY